MEIILCRIYTETFHESFMAASSSVCIPQIAKNICVILNGFIESCVTRCESIVKVFDIPIYFIVGE